MTGKRITFRTARAASLLAVTLAVGACTGQTAVWSPPESPKRNKIEWVVFDHTVEHSPGQTWLSRTEQRKLATFIDQTSLGYGDQIVIRARQGQDSRAARLVKAYFDSRTVVRNNNIATEIVETPRLSRHSGPVLVEVGRYVITPPRCPDWTKPSGTDPYNTVSSNFGCATVTNLDQMVANPADLVRGREMGPANGAYASFHNERYRLGVSPKVSKAGVLGETHAVK